MLYIGLLKQNNCRYYYMLNSGAIYLHYNDEPMRQAIYAGHVSEFTQLFKKQPNMAARMKLILKMAGI